VKRMVFLNPNGQSHSWLLVCQIMIIIVLTKQLVEFLKAVPRPVVG